MKYNRKGIALHDLVDGLLFSLQAEGKAKRTTKYYRDLLRPFLEYARDNGWSDDISHLDSQEIREFLSWVASRACKHNAGNGTRLTRTPKPTVAWPYYRALKRLFNWAIQEGLLDSSPMAKIHFKPPPEPPIEGYTLDELKNLLAVCDLDIKTGAHFTGVRNKAMLFLFIDSGLRRAEMANLRINDLDLNNKQIRVIGKGNKVGVVPFSAKTAKTIWLWLVERKTRSKTDNLWITEEGNAFAVEGLVSWFNRLKKRAGVFCPGGVHRLRHTAALQYLRGARDSFLLQLFLRHESLEMSRRYTQGLKHEEAIEAHRNGASPVERLGLG